MRRGKGKVNQRVDVRKIVDNHLLEQERIQQERASFESVSKKESVKKVDSQVKIIFFSPVTGDEYEQTCSRIEAESLVMTLDSIGSEYKIIG